jgi:hypothetical protein
MLHVQSNNKLLGTVASIQSVVLLLIFNVAYRILAHGYMIYLNCLTIKPGKSDNILFDIIKPLSTVPQIEAINVART